MAFPQTPLDARVELLLAGAWTRVEQSPTGVRGADKIVVTRGRADEQATGSQQPSTAKMAFNNRDGRYSPRNPVGALYGKIGRNTPIRVSTIGDGTTYCRMPGRYGLDNVTCPDAAGLHVTGDIDVRIDVTLANALQYQTLAVKGDWGVLAAGGNPVNLGWALYLGTSGQLRFAWSTNGTSAAPLARSTANLTAAQSGTQLAIRATLSVATGTVTFYTAPSISGSWTQLGATVVSGATSIFASTAVVQVGEIGTNAISLNSSIMAGRLNAFSLLNGIGGTAVANPVFNTQPLGTTSFADTAAAPNTWTLNGQCEITNRRYRFHGEVSAWPQEQDISGKDVWTPIEAAGVLRRYGQGTPPVTSPIRRAVSVSPTVPIVYWPCEDPAGAAQFAVGAGSGQPMTISGSPTLATDSHIAGSAPLPTLGGSTWTGNVPPYTPSSPNAVAVNLVAYVNSAPANGTVVARVLIGSTRFDLAWSTVGNNFYINAYDVGSGSLLGADNSGFGSGGAGTPYAVSMDFSQSGANINWSFQTSSGPSSSGPVYTALASRTLGQISQIIIDPNGSLTDTVIGHISAYNSQPFACQPQQTSLTGNVGETAGQRFVRLCLENGVQPRTVGDITDSPAMGAQGTDSFVPLLQSCIDADGGLLYEPRDVFGLGMVMRSGLMSQASAATLSFTGNQLSAVPMPIDDDQIVRNDVTVTRTGGSFARATLTSGNLSVQTPPNGIGTYPDTPTLNLQADSQLLNEASWRLHAQTVDESRWPLVTTAMHSNEMVANPTLAQQVQAADIGQVITITGMPATLPPDDTRQLIQGITETMSNFEFTLAFNCSPASPYDVLILDDGTFARLDTDGSTLNDPSLNTTATSFTVATTGAATGSPLWTTSAGDWPFDVLMDGERMTVTAVTGSSSPQTFTVTRSVNGVVKSHTSGAAISLQRPFYLSP